MNESHNSLEVSDPLEEVVKFQFKIAITNIAKLTFV